MRNTIRYLFVVLLLIMPCISNATVYVSHLFSNNMVFQRDKVIKVWGRAGNEQTVSIDFNGISQNTIVDSDSIWSIEMPAMSHGGPFDLTIRGKVNTIVLKNILIGDIWLCSGQSNMEFPLGAELTARESVKNAVNSRIRLLTVPMSVKTREDTNIAPTQWVVCTPTEAARFTAVGYFFGKQLQQDLNIPIGLIDASVGGTDIETWTSWRASMNHPEYNQYSGKTIEQVLGFTTEDVGRFQKQMETTQDLKEKWFAPSTKQEGWKILNCPERWNGPLVNEGGVVWFRTEIVLPDTATFLDASLQLGVLEAKDKVWMNGVEVLQMSQPAINGCYQIPVGLLKPGKNMIVARVKNSNFVGGIFSAPGKLHLEIDGFQLPLTGCWEYKPYLLSSFYGFKANQIMPNGFASLLYNGMIHPLTDFPIKGIIWYQGENNARNAYQYRTSFPNLITDWRTRWGEEFPFLWVQLTSFMQRNQQPQASEWAELREAQSNALSLPKTGQAVITDIGDSVDIHPRNKKEVGLRLARIAMSVAYGKEKLSSGPVFQKMEKEGNRLILSFTYTGGRLMTCENNKNNSVNGFTIAGSDQQFVWAQAYIKDNKVIVFSDKVTCPVAVRYGWADNPAEINLVNSEGLLASPFRSDSWKGITEK